MEKIMIVTDNASVGTGLEALLMARFNVRNVLVVTHQDAEEQMIAEQPTHILVCEYELETERGRWSRACQNWRVLSALASPQQRLVRCGFMDHKYDDFLRQPFDSMQLAEMLWQYNK